MKEKTYPPLAAVKRIAMQYPGLFEEADQVIHDFNEDYGWDKSVCYCNIGAAEGFLQAYHGLSEQDAAGMGAYIASAISWRQSKMVYKFDEDLLEEILDNCDDIVVPSEILHKLPAPCIFIEIPFPGFRGIKNPGFFVFIESEFDTRNEELRMVFVDDSGCLTNQYIVHIGHDLTIGEGIDATIRRSKQSMSNMEIPDDIANRFLNYWETMRNAMIQAVHLVLYICAENADIKRDSEHEKIRKKPTKGNIKDRYAELERFDVGKDLGPIIRKVKHNAASHPEYVDTDYDDEDTADHKPQNKKRTHLRRAHYHHYWRGPKDHQELFLRWINSTIVNGEVDDIPVIEVDME